MPEATILLADDHPQMLASTRRLLETEFDIVGAVSNGAALIEAALELEPDVIVTDLVMEPVNGLEAARTILSWAGRKPPVIVMLTAVSGDEMAQTAFAVGIRGFVSKTRIIEDLVIAIRVGLNDSQFASPMEAA